MRKHASTSIEYNLFSRYVSENSRGQDNPSFGKVWSHNPVSGDIKYTKRDLMPEDHVLGLPSQRGGNGPGSKWCNDSIVETMIQQDDDIPFGMKQGRLFKPPVEQLRRAAAARHQAHLDRRHADLMRGRISITKDGVFKRVPADLLDEYLQNGWVRRGQHRGLMIEGVRYDTARDVAVAYGIHHETVRNRVRNPGERWSRWTYA